MDKTVLTLAVDSTQVGTAAAAFDRMVDAGNAAAASAGKVTSTALAQGRAIGQTLVPALTRGAAGARTLAEAQKALGEDATRQAGQQLRVQRPAMVRDALTNASVTALPALPRTTQPRPQNAAVPAVAPGAALGAPGLSLVPGAANGARVSLERMTASANTGRTALTQLSHAGEEVVRSFRQINATPIRIAAPQGLSAAAAALTAAARTNPTPLRQVAAAWEETAKQAARASTTVSQANRVISAAPRGGMTQAGSAARAPLAAGDIISTATGQRVSTSLSTSEMTIEASRAQSAIERLTNAARDQRSALAQLAPAAAGTAEAYRQLGAAQGQPAAGGFGIPGARPVFGGAGAPRPSNIPGAAGNGRPAPAGGNQGGDAGSSAAQLQQLTYQLNDFFVQVASGGSPLTALIQQGSQLAGTYGGVRPAFQAVLNLLTPMRVAAGGTAIAVGAMAMAYRDAARESRAFKDASVLSGNFAGQTEGQFNALARSVSSSTQATISSAREMAQALLATGQIGPRSFDLATEAATRFSIAYKKSADETAGIFEKLADGPAKFAGELNKSMNLWSAAELKVLADMEDAGDTTGAQVAVLEKLNGRLKQLDGNLDGVDRALNKGKKSWADWWDAAKGRVGDMFGLSTVERAIERINSEMDKSRGVGGGFMGAKATVSPASRSNPQDLAYQQQDLLMGQARQQAEVQNEAERKAAQKRAVDANERVKSLLKRAKPESVFKEESQKLERDFRDAAYAGTPVSEADQKTARAQLKKDYTQAKSGGRSSNEGSQILAAQLQSDLRAITAAFDKQRDAFSFQSEFVETAYRNGNISLRTLMDQRRQVVEDQARAEIASLDKEAARLQQYLGTISDKSERAQVQGQLDEVGAERERVELRASRDVVLINEEEVSSFRALSEQVTNYRANLLQLGGDEAGAAALRAQTVIANARLLAAQSGGQISDRDVNELARLTAVLDQFNEVQRQTSLLAANSARAEEAFAMASEQSGRSLLETERGIYAMRVKELEQLGALAAKAKELAEVSTDPRIKAFAADLALEYAKAADAIDPALNRLRDASRQLAAGLSQTVSGAPNAFAEIYTQRRRESTQDIRSQKQEYDKRIDQLRGYLAQEKDERNKASLKKRIDQLQGESDGLKVESRGKSALTAINEAVLKPMAEQVSNTVTKLLIQDPLQKYLEGQLKALTEGDGFLAGFFKDALGIEADPKQQALLQQTAAITASTSALDVLTSAAQNAADALGRAPASAALAGDFRAPGDAPAVDGGLAGVGDASDSVSQFGTEALKTTSNLAQLANAADLGGGAMARLPGIIGLFQSAVAMLTSSSASKSGGNIISSIAGLFGGGESYEAAVASTGIFHVGGIVGKPSQTRDVPMGLFAGAPRYHTGGIVGKKADGARSALAAAAELKAGEVPAILMKNEEVLRADDPRHRVNLGAEVFAKVMQTKGENSAAVLQGLLGRLGVKEGGESAASGAIKVRGARELGGPVSSGGLYRVNERGPELLQVAGKEYLMMGSQGGRVESAGAGKDSGKSLTINVQVAAQPGMSRATAQQQGAQIARGIALAQRRNG